MDINRKELEEYKANLYIYNEYYKMAKPAVILLAFTAIFLIINLITAIMGYSPWKITIATVLMIPMEILLINHIANRVIKYGEKVFVFEQVDLGMNDNLIP